LHYRLVEVPNRLVAIKVLTADASRSESRRQMFREEARLASSVSHAHIVQVYEFGRDNDLEFIVIEYVEGQPLSRIIRGRPLPPRQVALAVARSRRQGLLPRDLKPGNILLTTDGEVKVVDFGLEMGRETASGDSSVQG